MLKRSNPMLLNVALDVVVEGDDGSSIFRALLWLTASLRCPKGDILL